MKTKQTIAGFLKMLAPAPVILFPVFIVWNNFNQYFFLFPIKHILEFLGIFFAIALAGYGFMYAVLRNRIKASVATIFFLLLFFFWGIIHDWFKSLSISPFFYSYSLLLPIVALCLFLIIIGLRKSKAEPVRLYRFFTMLFGIFVIIEAGTSLYYFIDGKQKRNDLKYNNPLLEGLIKSAPGSSDPDIFYFVFDEYASSLALERYFQFNNSGLDSMLRQKGFFLASASKSNYNSTPLSIASMLNMDYFNLPLEEAKTDPLNLLKGQYSIRESRVPELLEERGYSIMNFGITDLGSAEPDIEPNFYKNIPSTFWLPTLWGRIRRDIFWNISSRFSDSITDRQIKARDSRISTDRRHLELAVQALRIGSSTPRFVFSHFMTPHEPYYYKKDGSLRHEGEYDYLPANDSLYLNQLAYINSWIKEIVDAASISATKRPRVIIIAGDHGKRSNIPAAGNPHRQKDFMTLNAIFFSDGDYSALYDSISPVNSFRVIFNKYFQSSLPMLKDSSVYLF